MPGHEPFAIDTAAPPFDRYTGLHRLAASRSGHRSPEHVRHQLYAGIGRDNPVRVLFKLTSRPGLVYERDLANEIASLETINGKLPDSRYFPFVHEHGRLRDGRLYLVMSLFEEFPLATIVGEERMPGRLPAHLMAIVETTRAVRELHAIDVFHVDLNPMNILYRTEGGRPVIRIVDFESSYERARHAGGAFYNPPTTPGYSAPEISKRPPDARSDVFSLGAVLHTLVASDLWVPQQELVGRIETDHEIDDELRKVLLKAVATDPAQRYASAADLERELTEYLERIWPGRAW